MADDDLVVVDENFLDDEAQQALSLNDIQRFGGRTQTGEEAGDGFGEAQPHFALRRMVDDCLQLRLARLFATPQIGHSAARFAECGLTLHPDKTKIVYCKDDDRRGDFPDHKFDFLGYTFRPRLSR